MSNIIQLHPSPATDSTASAPRRGALGTVVPFLSIAECEGRAIDAALASADRETTIGTLMRMALNGRAPESRSRASAWLEEVVNVRVM